MRRRRIRFDKKDGCILAVLLGMAAAFVLLFGFSTSPLYPATYGEDATFFQLMGRLTKHGQLPYVDFFDIKGPLLFLLQAIGNWLYEGRLGVFILQFFFMSATFLLLFALARVFLPRQHALVTVTLAALLLLANYGGGNLCEEYSMPFVLLPLLLCCRALQKGAAPLPWSCSLLTGLCFGCLVMIRSTNAAPLCGMLLALLLWLVYKRRFRELGVHALRFVLGAALAVAPFLLYFAAHGALQEMLNGTFLFPAQYGIRGLRGRSPSQWLELFTFLTPVLYSAAVGLLYLRRGGALGGVLFGVSCATVLAFLMGNAYPHYFMMTVPGFALGVILTWALWRSRHGARLPGVCLRAFALALAVLCLYNYLPRVQNQGVAAPIKSLQGVTAAAAQYRDARAQASLIPAQERGSVLVCLTRKGWMCANGIAPCRGSMYYPNNDPHDWEKVARRLQEDPPLWISSRIDAFQFPSSGTTPRDRARNRAREIVAAEYSLVSNVSDVQVYKRKA